MARNGSAPYPGNLNRVGIAKFQGTNRVRGLTKGNGMSLRRVNQIAGRVKMRLHATKGWRRS